MFNVKGQSGDVFKLLIGAVIGVAIIAIIYSIITIMENQKSYLSEEVFSNKILMAMKNPTGKEYFINDYLFEKNKSLSKKALAEKSGMGFDCITFKKELESSRIKFNDNLISFSDNLVVDVGISCVVPNASGECDISCILTIYDKGVPR